MPSVPLWLPVLAPVLASAVGYYLPRAVFQRLLLLFQLVQTAVVTLVLLAVRAGGPQRLILGGWRSGVGIALEADVVSAALVALVGWFFLLLLVFNTRKQYMDRLFQFLLGILQGLLIGLFLAGDLFNIYVLLELSTLVVGILIMYKRNKQALYNGMVYITVNLASMSFMLLGVGLVYRSLGTLDISQIALLAAEVTDPRALMLPYAFVMTAVSVKAALFLLFGWLPPAHGAPSAPSVVSAVLSGLQVKAGVYLFIRIQEAFAPAIDSQTFFLVIGALTAVCGFVLAIAQKDIKLILAYHTISQIGLIMIGLNAGTDAAWWGGVYHIINHAFFKALLFLTAGVVIHRYGTRNVYHIRGVLRTMPLIGVGMLAGMLGITGAPYFNGSVSKYLIQSGWSMTGAEAAMYLINLGTAVSFVKFSTMLFGRPVADTVEAAGRDGQPDLFTRAVSLVMGTACLVGGTAAAPILTALFGQEIKLSGAYILEKFITYMVTVGVAVIIYLFVVRRTQVLDTLRTFRFRLNELILGVVVFFSAILSYLFVFVA